MRDDETLGWAIKPSFVEYVTSMDDGAIDLAEGARRGNRGYFLFPRANMIGSVSAQYEGSVTFTGHHGLLYLAFGRPALERTPDGLFLTIADADEDTGRLAFLRLTQAAADNADEERDGIVAFDSELTVAGADLFFANYRPGISFGEVRVRAGLVAASHPGLVR